MDNQLNDKNMISHNNIFDFVLNMERRLTSYKVKLFST
jgi:hypothetical protein